MKTIINLLIAALLTFVSGCQTTSERLLDSDQSQLKLRSIQTKAFDTSDKEKTMRSVMATLQDLEFVIDKADLAVGVVTATKLSGYMLKMSVTVNPRGEKQMIVRANAQYNVTPVTDPEPYQRFFAALSKSMFLTAHNVD
jgi:hypothetical protein